MTTSVCSQILYSQYQTSVCLKMASGGRAEEACSEEVLAEDLHGQDECDRKPTAPLPTERCGHHGEETLQMYCRDHDEVVCNTCISMQHSSCTDIVSIPSNINDLLDTLTPATVKAELSATQVSLKHEEKLAEINIRKHNETKNRILTSVENHGQVLKAMIDKLVEESKADIEDMGCKIESQLKDEIEKIKEDQKELDEREKEFDTAEEQNNKSLKFVLMKKYQSRMTESKNKLKDIKALRGTNKLGYHFNKDIENSLKKFASLGSVTDQHEPLTHPYTQPPLWTIQGEKTIKVCDEETPCSAASCCQLSDGCFLVADWNHQKIVKLDNSCSKIMQQCQVPGYPYALCDTGGNEVAVSLQFIQTIQFVSYVKSGMTLTRSRKFQHQCGGLAFSQGELFVSDGGNKVYVYDKDCKILRTLGTSIPGLQGTSTPGLQGTSTPGLQGVFSNADHIAISSDERRVFVANWATGLVCVDRKGKLLFTCCDSRLQYAHGVCIDNCGSLFVCGYGSHNVIQLSENGQVIGVLLQESSTIQQPVSVRFDKKNKKLLVTKDTDSSVSVLQLK